MFNGRYFYDPDLILNVVEYPVISDPSPVPVFCSDQFLQPEGLGSWGSKRMAGIIDNEFVSFIHQIYPRLLIVAQTHQSGLILHFSSLQLKEHSGYPLQSDHVFSDR